MQLLVVMMKMNALSRDYLMKMRPPMTSIRIERRKAEWNESMKDSNLLSILAEVSIFYPW